MKILLATSKAIPGGGGIASYNQELVRLLGNNNEIVLLTDSDEHNVKGYVDTCSTFGYSNNNVAYAKDLIESINNAGYDCIINSNSSFLPVMAPFLTVPIVTVSHFVNGRHAVNAGYNADYLNAVIALSHYGKQFIESKFDIRDKDKVKVVYNFVAATDDVDSDKPSRRPIRIVYPGGTSIEKSVDVIQQLVYRLLASDLDFEFYWLGGTQLPSAKMTLLGLHKSEDLFKKDSRIHITGIIPRQEAEKILMSSNIFLLPSRGEGCPMTLLEAMRGGCIPIVSDAHHGSREIIEQSAAGIIVRQNSSKQLFDEICKIIEHPEDYEDYYVKSRKYLNTYLSQDVWAEHMLSIINNAISISKNTIPFTPEAYVKSVEGFVRLNKHERLRMMGRSAWYRLKFDLSYLWDKIGAYHSTK